EARIGEDRERRDDGSRAYEPELLADDGIDHVRGGLGQVVDLLNALPEADPEDASGPERDHRLDGLEAGSLGIVPWVEEAEDAGAPVGLQPDRREDERGSETARAQQSADGRARDEQHRSDHDPDRERGA